MNLQEIVSTFLPSGLLDHFIITDFKEAIRKDEKQTSFFLYLDEKNILPPSYDSSDYESKGFYGSKTVQDFPIRGKALYLVVRRRRWRLKSDPSIIIQSDYSFIAEGVKLTQEVADFLKGTSRDPHRYDQ